MQPRSGRHTEPSQYPAVEHLFRHRYGRMVAGLCRVLGPGRLDLVEDVVQEAMLRALRSWPADGVPERPDAWVFRVARNLALDMLRRRAVDARLVGELVRWAGEGRRDADPGEGPADDTLRMMFLCSHPALPADTRVPLVLKTVGGFGVPEIAAALLLKEGTVAQRLSRGKARLQGGTIRLEMPPAAELPERLPLVLEVLYLMFNEGWRSHRGADLVREDLVREAVRLCALLLEEAATARPEVHALLALMLFLGARLPSRTDAAGELLTLAEQDRGRWDAEWLRCGFWHFARSIGGDRLTVWHVEAAIASLHAGAQSYEATDWVGLLREYDRLLQLAPSPIVRLNRAVVLAKVHGPAAGLGELMALQQESALEDYFLMPATRAHLHWQLGDHGAAARALEQALAMPCTEPEKRLLGRRLEACRRGEAPPKW
jgi:RNA polymerase sigma-70 factor (ECF subfamily)